MPGYTYLCEDCGYVPAFQGLSEEPLTACPECGREGARRAITPESMAQTQTYVPSMDRGYFKTLARFPGDPEAHVGGPDSLRRLVDRRKRDGWTVHTKGEPDLIEPKVAKKQELAAERKELLKREFGI